MLTAVQNGGRRIFPDAEISYFNAGIGATTSQFGGGKSAGTRP